MSGSTEYPVKQFTEGFASPSDALISEVDEHNKAGARPGKQQTLKETPIDDIYPNGKPYKGADKLEGKTALITGGDSGIGRAIAILFAIEGAHSSICYLPEEQKDAENVRDYVSKKTNGKGRINLIPGDLKSEDNCRKAVDAHLKEFGRLDILVNNSAQQLENHDMTTLSSKQWEECFQLNMHHMFYLSKAAIPHMPKGSAIINMASINAFIGRDDLLDYTSTKGAIVSFTRGLSNQVVGSKLIRVNAIAPGPVYTPLITSTFSKDNVKGIDSTPIGRPSQPVEIACAAVFLASEDSSSISGNVIHVNGGTVIS